MDKQHDVDADGLPDNKPRRGKVLPIVKRAVASKVNDNTRAARNNFSKHVETATGLLGDFCSRMKRLQGLCYGKFQDKEKCEARKMHPYPSLPMKIAARLTSLPGELGVPLKRFLELSVSHLTTT